MTGLLKAHAIHRRKLIDGIHKENIRMFLFSLRSLSSPVFCILVKNQKVRRANIHRGDKAHKGWGIRRI